jgi:2'-5' RNA ligase
VFSVPAYIVLDLPPAVSAEVIALRSRYDAFEAQLPPEITIAGSSGVGVLAEHQDAEYVFQAIQRVGQQHLPFVSAFVSTERFPGVPVFWLKPRDRAPFEALQRALVAAGIRFGVNPFPFNPHCTISSTVKLTESQEHELLNASIPRQEFVLAKLSVYQLVEGRASLLQSFSFPELPSTA